MMKINTFGTHFGVAVALCLLTGMASAVEFATPFADGMVLQRDRAVPVWGTAQSNETVTVTFGAAEVRATADAAGAWRVDLPAMPASKEGRSLSVTSAGDARGQTLSDVLVGEVWIVSGQSNCELPLVSTNPHFSDRLGRLVAGMTRQPNIRFAYASTYRWSRTERKELRQRAEWKPFLPQHLKEGKSFSAMGVYFALDLYAALDIPVGLVGVYWGGTRIEPWIPREAFANLAGFEWCRDWQYVDDKDWKSLADKHRMPWPNSQPSGLWNDMAAPWTPMAARGVIWYQGCSNSLRSGKDEGDGYRRLMHAFYDSWSARFANPDLKLYFVQLAPFSNWWDVQLAQTRFAAEEKNAALVPTCDIGNLHDIHPNEKGTIGKRLAALALSRDYGFTDLVAEAPAVRTCVAEGERVVLSFDRAERWFLYNADWSVDVPFELAGADGVWRKASLVNTNSGLTNTVPWKTKGEIAGRELVLKANGVTAPTRVRYLHEKPWAGFLYADSGLPLGPFECAVRRLVWSDEFDGTSLDPAKWGYELGFIRNREYQYYTNLPENVRVADGKLILQARRVDQANPDYDAAAPTNDWKRTRPKLTITSGSVNTRGKFAFAGGRLECRAKVPAQFGTWPAIWTLGANIGEVGWPKCGEIDILEHYGKTPDWVTCNLHGFSPAVNKYVSPGMSKLTGETPADDFHVYAMEWDSKGVTCFYDGRPYGRYSFEKYGEAFAKPHYILLNLAMGAPWMMPEEKVVVEEATRFEIDWIRVYE